MGSDTLMAQKMRGCGGFMIHPATKYGSTLTKERVPLCVILSDRVAFFPALGRPLVVRGTHGLPTSLFVQGMPS